MPAMVSAVTVTVPPKTGADFFPSIFQENTNERNWKNAKQSTSRPLDVQSLTLYQTSPKPFGLDSAFSRNNFNFIRSI